MSFIVILACLLLQWFLQLNSVPYQYHWEETYFRWMKNRCEALTKGHALFTSVLLVLPVVIAASLLFTLVYHFLGYIGYSVLSLALLWYCVDLVAFRKIPTEVISTADLLTQAYQKLFAPLFWYFVFGPVGLILYVSVEALHQQWIEQKYFIMLRGILDWVPLRLMSLSFALVGNFGAVFKEWMKTVLHGVSDNYDQMLVCGDAAISSEKNEQSASLAAFLLIQRVVLIWLVVMALITVGRWIG